MSRSVHPPSSPHTFVTLTFTLPHPQPRRAPPWTLASCLACLVTWRWIMSTGVRYQCVRVCVIPVIPECQGTCDTSVSVRCGVSVCQVELLCDVAAWVMSGPVSIATLPAVCSAVACCWTHPCDGRVQAQATAVHTACSWTLVLCLGCARPPSCPTRTSSHVLRYGQCPCYSCCWSRCEPLFVWQTSCCHQPLRREARMAAAREAAADRVRFQRVCDATCCARCVYCVGRVHGITASR